MKAPVLSERNRIGTRHCLTRIKNCIAGVRFFGIKNTLDRHSDKAIVKRFRVLFCSLNIGFQALYRISPSCDFLRIELNDLIFKSIFFREEVGFKQSQFLNLNIQVHFLFDIRIACRKHFDFSIGQCGFVNILAGTDGRFARHNLRSEFLLALYKLIEVSVEGFLGHETVNIYRGIFVALTDTSAETLFQIGRSPRTVKVAGCGKFVLHIRTGSHLCGASHQDTDITSANLLKEFKFLCFGVRFVYKLDFLGGYSTLYELLTNIIIHGKIAVVFRGGKVTEEQLRQPFFLSFFPSFKHCVHTGVQLTALKVGEHWVNQSLVKSQLSAIVGDFQHIIYACVHHTVADFFCSLCKLGYHLLLDFRRLNRNVVIDSFRNGQVKHICGFYVRNLFEYCHQLRQVVEPCEPCFCSVACSFGCQFHRRNGFAKGRSPRIKVLKIVFYKGVVLQVSLNGVKLHHRIGDRRSGCKYRTTTARNLVKVAALHKKIAGFLRFSLCDTADIPHFGIEEKVLVVMAFIYEKPVHAEFLKGYNIVLFRLVVELVEFLLNGFFRAFQLLDREIISSVSFQVCNTVGDFFKLLFKDSSLPFNAHRDFLKLRMPDDDSVVIPGSNSTAEPFTVFGFKVFLRSHQNISGRIELQELRRPLFSEVIRDYEQRFTAQSEPFRLHSSRRHFKGFACADGVCKERIAAVKDMRHRISLVFPKLYFRVHSIECDMASVILTGTDTIELFVVELAKSFSALRIRPYPILKALLDKLLLCLSDCGFFFIQNCFLLAVCIFFIIEDTHILQVQRFLDNLVSIDTACAISAVRFDISSVVGFALDIPFSRVLGKMDFDVPLCISRRTQELKHKLLDNLRRKPSRTETDGNLTCRQVFRLHLLERFHIDTVIFG